MTSKETRTLRPISVFVWICLVAASAQAQYSGGTGEPNDPYQIATAEDLMLLGETPDDYDKHFILTADIDLNPNLPGRKVFDRAVIAPHTDPNNNWGGFQGIPFKGVFDGNGHTVCHLTIQGGSYLGLFGQLGSWDSPAGGIRNLGLVDVNIIGTGTSVGGLVGANFGVAGGYFSHGSIDSSYSSGSVCGYFSTGGIVGSNGGELTGCHSTCAVDGESVVGGLAGSNGGALTGCYSKSMVTGTDGVGGFVGGNWGTVTQCYGEGSVSGDRDVGGLVGYNTTNLGYRGVVAQCYSTGTVSGYDDVGGLVGFNLATVTQCYSTGAVSGTGADQRVGGLVGLNVWFIPPGGTVIQCFWDVNASGQTVSDGGTGKTTAEMQAASTFLEADWDFVDETENGTEDIWKIAEGFGYPRLSWEKYSGGTGEPNDPYQIATFEDLMRLGETPEDYDKHFLLTNDLDLDPNLPGRKVFDKAVIAPDMNDMQVGLKGTRFTGVFNGGGHTISHLTIKGKEYLGLFGQLGWFTTPVGEVNNIGIVDINITGSGSFIGGLVGHTYPGIVTHCYSIGTIRGDQYVGGLVGANDGTVSLCFSAGSVNGIERVGGLVGLSRQGCVTQCCSNSAVSGSSDVGGLVGGNGMKSSVTDCYSAATVSGIESAGGLVGSNDGGHINRSYCIGLVSGHENVGGLVGNNGAPYVGVSQSFWDIETSGQVTSAGGTGKMTTEMQTASTFLDAGWDFVDEKSNGTDDIWWILEGQDYPRLWWETK